MEAILLLEAANLGYKIGMGIGAAGILIGAAIGIGMIGSSAVNSVARQPEANDKIRNLTIITAALIEGIAIIGLVFTFIITL